MVDLMSGPDYPLAKGFELAGWRISAVDWACGEEHDLAETVNQVATGEQLKQADFIWEALDCFDESWIREVPGQHASGKTCRYP